MAEARPIVLAFNGGRMDARMYGRVDMAAYRTGCRTIDNFIPTVQGAVIKRSGTRFVKAVYDQTKKSRLIPFEFSRDQAYMLELAEGAMRFMRDSGAVLEASVAISGNPTQAANCEITTGAAHGYSTGDQVYVSGSSLLMLNAQFFTITVTGATTFTIGQDTTAETPTGGPGTVARVYQIKDGVSSNSLPWLEADLAAIQYAQDADVMYLVHPDYPPHKLARVSDTSWTCVEATFEWPQFREENITDTTVYVSAATGTSVTVTASAATFTADMVDGYIKIGELVEAIHPKWAADSDMATAPNNVFNGGIQLNDFVRVDDRVYQLTATGGAAKTGSLPPVHTEGAEIDRPPGETSYTFTYINRGFGYAKVTGYTSPTVITVNVDGFGVQFPASVVGSGNATKKWALGAFSDEYGYPAAVTFYERRLWFGGTAGDPQTFWGSRTNRYEDFEMIADEADSGLLFTIASNKINPIQWLLGRDVMMIGTLGGEFTASSGSADAAITPDNINVKQQSSFGSANNVAPAFVDSSLIMAHRSARRLHELTYDFQTDRYQGVDLTAYAHDIALDGIAEIVYQAAPFRQIWIRTATGELAAMTYAREENVTPWADFTVGNVAGGATPTVESIAVIPHPDGDQDQLWLIVNRTIGGATKRWIEYLEKPFYSTDTIADAAFTDASVSYSGGATTTLYGLLHVANRIVTYILADGTVGTASVTGHGKITVASTTSAQVGFLFTSQLETVDLEVGGPPNYTTHGDRGRVVSAVIRVEDTGKGVEYGQRLTGTLDTWNPETAPLYSGDSPRYTLPGGYDRSRRIAIQHAQPVPFTLVALIAHLSFDGD